MEFFTGIFAAIAAWLDLHPAVVSWCMGWLSAICAGQTMKQVLPASWTVTDAKRAVQAIATLAGSVTAYLLWPPKSEHAALYAVIVGMSSPTAYTFLKAIIEARWPGLAYRLSWSRVQDRDVGEPAPGARCDPPR